jgi:hypothetical protein
MVNTAWNTALRNWLMGIRLHGKRRRAKEMSDSLNIPTSELLRHRAIANHKKNSSIAQIVERLTQYADMGALRVPLDGIYITDYIRNEFIAKGYKFESDGRVEYINLYISGVGRP